MQMGHQTSHHYLSLLDIINTFRVNMNIRMKREREEEMAANQLDKGAEATKCHGPVLNSQCRFRLSSRFEKSP